MLFSDDIHEPTITHESPQSTIYIAIHMESMVCPKCHRVTLGLKSMLDAFIGIDEQYDIVAFCSQWFRKVFQVYHLRPMGIQDIWYEALILIFYAVLLLGHC
jgi:hypothetical protein